MTKQKFVTKSKFHFMSMIAYNVSKNCLLGHCETDKDTFHYDLGNKEKHFRNFVEAFLFPCGKFFRPRNYFRVFL